MRSTVVPAQITTVEDKIAGSLNMAQILLLVGAIFLATIFYAVLPRAYHLNPGKILIILLSILICGSLALRIKGKLVFDWLRILSSYNLRPKYYVFDKNDIYLRNLFLPEVKQKPKLSFTKKKAKEIAPTVSFDLKDSVQAEALVRHKKLNVSFKTNSKGGMNVAFE